jgi:hypothetical protein
MTRRGWATGLVGLVILNGLLSFTAWWPTPAVLPDLRIAPEFVLLWLTMLLIVRIRGALPRSIFWLLCVVYTVFVLARYLDVTAPSLFGRPVNLYWDIPQIPRFLWVSASEGSWWVSALVTAAAASAIGALIGAIGWSITRAVEGLAIPLRKRLWVWVVTGLLSALIAANYAGIQATWPFVSKPVIPTYYKQMGTLWDAYSPSALARILPDQTPIESALQKAPHAIFDRLQQRDVHMIFLESFGALLYDDAEAFASTHDERRALARAIKDSGRHVVTGFFRSPTIGGASDLAHMAVLSGVDLSDPRRHDLLLTTDRPTLIQLFKKIGYETFGLYHAVSWPWPERVFYGFNHYLDAPSLSYRGPALGFWSIPDQYAIARFMALHPRGPGSKPQFLFFPTITSHFPFSPVPPYQPDWARILSENPFDEEDLARALAERPNWLNMRPDYLRMVNYVYQWLTGLMRLNQQREAIYLLIGDHQPTANISGEGVPWDVPVHVISNDPTLLTPLQALGFSEGLAGSRTVLGGLHDLPVLLLQAWSTDRTASP